jgi:DNA-binding response OmpR family regulator
MISILFVDDDENTGLMYAKALTFHGHSVTVAKSMLQAMQSIDKSHYDFIFIDIKMPDFNGLDFIKWLRANSKNTNAHLAILSNSESQKTVQQAKDLGIEEYLVKVDYSPYGLAQYIDQHINNNSVTRR